MTLLGLLKRQIFPLRGLKLGVCYKKQGVTQILLVASDRPGVPCIPGYQVTAAWGCVT